MDVLAPIPGAAPAEAGDLLGPDRVGGTRPGLVDSAGLHRGECRLARLRPLRRHRKAAVAPGGAGHLRPGAVDRRPVVERWAGCHARGVVPGHQPVRRRCPAATGASRDLSVGRLHRRLSRPDVPGRDSGVRLHRAVVAQRASRHPADVRPAADAGRTPTARRRLALAGTRPVGDQGAHVGMRQLFGQQSAQPRFDPGLHPLRLGPCPPLHPSRRQMGDLLLGQPRGPNN